LSASAAPQLAGESGFAEEKSISAFFGLMLLKTMPMKLLVGCIVKVDISLYLKPDHLIA
jgi:hypothetical protein